MNFQKDLLLIDTEFTGFDLQKHEIIQLAAVLLDKHTLREKKYFCTYIKPTPGRWKHRDPQSMKVNGINYDVLKKSPSLRSVIRKFDTYFGKQVLQVFYVGYNDKRFLLESYRRSDIAWKFDYHYLDLWGLFYCWLAKRNLLRDQTEFAGFKTESMLEYFGIDKPKALHDALTDCRVAAQIFRRVMKEL